MHVSLVFIGPRGPKLGRKLMELKRHKYPFENKENN
jgi:hypothetical protein